MQNEDNIKALTLFDHIKHIRETKSKDYISNLSEKDLASFNKYVLLLGFGMDQSLIDEISYISKYLEYIPNEQFYKILCDIVPHGRKYSEWIKSETPKINYELLELVMKYFKIGKFRAIEYCQMMLKMDSGIKELIDICKKYGKSEKEIEKMFE